jgi:hypothetical protein
MSNDLQISFNDLKGMGQVMANSKLFGVKTADEAIALMLIAQAEGLHPAIAARDYHIIQGRPSLKADAMLSRFQNVGGKIKWHELTDTIADATFSHPQGGDIRLSWDIKRAEQAQLVKGKDNWVKYPRAMLRARLISEAIRTIFPSCVSGVYTPEEIEDLTEDPKNITHTTPKTEEKKPVTEPKKETKELLSKTLDVFEYRFDETNKLHVVSTPDGEYKTSDNTIGDKAKDVIINSTVITIKFMKVKQGFKLLDIEKAVA